MGMTYVFCRYHAIELGLDLEGRLAGCHAGPIADTEDMRVDGDSRLTKCNVEHDVCRFAADAGQGLQGLARARNLTAVRLHDFLRQSDEILCFGTVEADRLYQLLHALLPEWSHFLLCVRHGEQSGRRLVDSGIGCLR